MVELNLDRLPPGRSTLELDHTLVREDQVAQGHRIEGFTAHVSGSLDVDAMDQKILVHGRFEAEREMICDRSGDPFPMRYPVEIEVLVLRRPRRPGEDVEDDDSWVIHQPGGVVHLDEALLEAVVLDQPQHVVSPQWRDAEGLPGGGRFGDESDDAESEAIDPRWEALRRLREAERRDGDN